MTHAPACAKGDKETRDGIHKIFNLFDDDKTGTATVECCRWRVCKLLARSGTRTITLKNLKRVSKELGETMTEEEHPFFSTSP